MFDMNYFANNRLRVLVCLYESADKNHCTRITQQEVADQLALSRITVNNIFQQLKNDGYIEFDAERVGKYTLTPNAVMAVKTILLTNDEIEFDSAN